MNYLKFAIFFFSSFLLFLPKSLTAENVNDNCQEIKEKIIEIEEIISPNQSLRALKTELTDQALMEAVKETVGIQVRSFEGSHIEAINYEETDSYKSLISSKTKGLVKSYEVTQEIITKGNLNILKLIVSAKICIPNENFLKETVAIGNFRFQDSSNYIPARNLLSSLFPTENEKYYLAAGHATETYHDIEISGSADVSTSVSSKIEAQQKSQQNEKTSKIIGGLTQSLLGVNLGNLASDPESAIPKKKISVSITLSAVDVADQDKIIETLMVEKENLPIDVDEDSIVHDALWEGITKASSVLYSKMTGAEVAYENRRLEKKLIHHNKSNNRQSMDVHDGP
jgi:hypothetical protein